MILARRSWGPDKFATLELRLKSVIDFVAYIWQLLFHCFSWLLIFNNKEKTIYYNKIIKLNALYSYNIYGILSFIIENNSIDIF